MKRLKILLVEDNPDDVKITQRTLKKGNLKDDLFVVMDGQEALDFLAQRGQHQGAPKPDLIFLDINIPKINGLEVLGQIKKQDSLRRIPVIVLTSSKSEEDRIRAYDSGASSYIQKPASSSELIRAINTVRDYWEMAELPPE